MFLQLDLWMWFIHSHSLYNVSLLLQSCCLVNFVMILLYTLLSTHAYAEFRYDIVMHFTFHSRICDFSAWYRYSLYFLPLRDIVTLGITLHIPLSMPKFQTYLWTNNLPYTPYGQHKLYSSISAQFSATYWAEGILIVFLCPIGVFYLVFATVSPILLGIDIVFINSMPKQLRYFIKYIFSQRSIS